MTYEEWEKSVPQEITGDTVWRIEGYRLSLFAADIGWLDVTVLSKDRRTWGVSDQLCRALGSVSANIEEGYSKGTGKDRARFYEYALGSARESRGWCYKGRHILAPDVAIHRMWLLTHIIKLLLTMVPEQRGLELRDDSADYGVPDLTISDLLQKIPLA